MFRFHNNVFTGPFQTGSRVHHHRKARGYKHARSSSAPLHLIFSNYNLLERHFTDASLPPPSWLVEVFPQVLLQQHSPQVTRDENIWGFFWTTGGGQINRWWWPSVTRICKVLHGCSVTVQRVGRCHVHLASKVAIHLYTTWRSILFLSSFSFMDRIVMNYFRLD